MSLSPIDVCVQLPAAKRWGSIIGGSSTRQQAAREADAVGLLGTRLVTQGVFGLRCKAPPLWQICPLCETPVESPRAVENLSG